MVMDRKDWLIVIGGSALIVVVYTLLFPGALESTDREVLWQSGVRMRAGGGSLYGWAQGETDAPIYLYPPAYSMIWAALGVFSKRLAIHLWVWLSLFAAISGLLRLASCFACGRREYWKSAALAVAVVLSAWTFDYWVNGANLLIAGLVAHSLAERLRGRFALAALFLAAAVHTKVIPIALLPFFVIRGDWRFLGWFVAAMVAIHLSVLICTLPALGLWDGLAQLVRLPLGYLSSLVLPHATNVDASVVTSSAGDNMSLTDAVRRVVSVQVFGYPAKQYRELEGTKIFGYIGFMLAFGLYTLGLLLMWKRKGKVVLVTAAGISFAASILGNVSTLNQHVSGFVVMLLGFVLVTQARPEIRRVYFVTLALYYLGVMFPLTAYYSDPSESTFLSRIVDWGGPTMALTAMTLIVFVVAWKYAEQPAVEASPEAQATNDNHPEDGT